MHSVTLMTDRVIDTLEPTGGRYFGPALQEPYRRNRTRDLNISFHNFWQQNFQIS
jgi:hypothetical protein